jgi:hypothetical protein
MVDVAELKRRHEALCATEDKKDKLIAVCFGNTLALGLLTIL